MTTLGAAIWEGGQTRLGHTLWQSLDSAALAGVSIQILKLPQSLHHVVRDARHGLRCN